jgi:hypothetical protein
VLPTVTTTAYVMPLREGGSLPGIVEGDDLGTYVAKFSAAGQGPKALVAEIVVGELGRRIGLRVPRLVLLDLDASIGRSEPDEEVQELLVASAGLNLGVDFLPGSLAYTSACKVDPEFAAKVVWLDALITNVDRTPRNPNLLSWHGQIWLIDHGAALYRQHGGDLDPAQSFPQIRDHVLLPHSENEGTVPSFPLEVGAAVDAVPQEWLIGPPREDYRRFLTERLARGDFVDV